MGHEHRQQVARLGPEQPGAHLPLVSPTKVTETIKAADAALINIRATEVHLHALPDPVLPRDLRRPARSSIHRCRRCEALAEAYELGLPIDAEDAGSIAGAMRTLSEDRR